MTQVQRRTLSELQQRKDLIVLSTDKNLGPCILARSVYIQRALQEHLLNVDNYCQLPPEEATTAMETQKQQFLECYTRNRESLQTTAEKTYFERATKTTFLNATRIPQFYGMPKVHKPGVSMRPVISSVNSVAEIFSKWVDYKLKSTVTELLPTHIRDSDHLQQSLLEAFPDGIPAGAQLFTVDAVGMYSNIDTPHGMAVVKEWLSHFKDQLPDDFPTEFLTEALELVMTTNIFQFGDTFWKQLRGTAMGTSTAVNYAYLYVGLLEVQHLLVHHKVSLLFYKRFVDDGFGVFLTSANNPGAWDAFMADLNNWGSLKWTTEGRSDSVIFLDLTIKIDPSSRKLIFQSYSKPMNLYLYIPPSSAHPKGILRSLIFGRLRTYWRQNTYKNDFLKMRLKLWGHLVDRGYTSDQLLPLFNEASQKIVESVNKERHNDVASATEKPNTLEQKQFFFHLKYHPRGIQRTDIRGMYHRHLTPLLPDTQFTVALHRPKNLRDKLCATVMAPILGKNPSDFL